MFIEKQTNGAQHMQKFRTLTDNEACNYTNGTCLQGYVDISYARLVELLGEPSCGDGYKVDAEWVILFGSGAVATIYNYKDGVNYNGKNGTAVEQLRDWHIGGNSAAVVSKVGTLLGVRARVG